MRTQSKWIFILALLITNIAMAASFDTQSWQTKNGVRVVFYPAMEVPMLDINIAFAAGSAYDGTQFGLSALTTQLINQGNGGLDASQIAEKIEKTGAQFNATNNRDMAVLSLRTLTSPDALKEATDAFTLIINHPDFPENMFIQEKNQLLMAIKQAQDSPDEVANQAFFKALYHDHPYAHPINGDTTHVTTLTPTQVHDFYQRYFVGKNAVLVLVGAINTQTAHQLANSLTADLPAGEASAPLPKAKPLEKSESINISFPSSQTMVRLGQLGIRHDNPHYFPLVVGNYILGGGALVSNLAIELREKRGLTYGVTSQFSPMPGVGPFLISFSTRNDQAQAANQLTREILTEFVKNGPTASQVKAAQQFLTGGFPLSLASNRNIADLLLRITFYHLPENYLNTYIQHVNAVTIQEIKDAFQAQIFPNALLEVTVGK